MPAGSQFLFHHQRWDPASELGDPEPAATLDGLLDPGRRNVSPDRLRSAGIDVRHEDDGIGHAPATPVYDLIIDLQPDDGRATPLSDANGAGRRPIRPPAARHLLRTRPRRAALARPKLITIRPSVAPRPLASASQSHPSRIRLRNPSST